MNTESEYMRLLKQGVGIAGSQVKAGDWRRHDTLTHGGRQVACLACANREKDQGGVPWERLGHIISRFRTQEPISPFETIIRPNPSAINQTLRSYFTDPLEFRKLQTDTNAYLHGSCVYKFFCGAPPSSKLEIIVPMHTEHTQSASIMRKYIEQEGYECEEEKEYKLQAKVDIKELSYGTASRTDRKILLTIVDGPPVAFILLQGWTADMNFVTWNKAYSLFPRMTFDHKLGLYCSPYDKEIPKSELDEKMSRFKNDGITTRTTSNENQPEVTTHSRRIGDDYTVTIDLDTEGLESTVPDNVLESTTFRINRENSRYVLCPLTIISHPLLGHEYVVVTYIRMPSSQYCEKLDKAQVPFRQWAIKHSQGLKTSGYEGIYVHAHSWYNFEDFAIGDTPHDCPYKTEDEKLCEALQWLHKEELGDS